MGSGGAAAAAAPERCPAPHPAVLAWGRLTGTAAAATRVSVLKRGHKSQVYRLHGLLDGRAVIAKRCPTGTARIERTVHERILPEIGRASCRERGLVAGGGRAMTSEE